MGLSYTQGAALVSSFMLSAVLSPSPALGGVQHEAVTVAADELGIGYIGTDADDELYVLVAANTITIQNRGNVAWGTVTGCEHVVDDDLEYAQCPIAPTLTFYLGGAMRGNRVYIDYEGRNPPLRALWVFGGNQPDRVRLPTDSRADVSFVGHGGNDYFAAAKGADGMEGGPGNDRLWGRGGDDDIHGGPKSDRLSGGSGADTLDGDRGSDLLYGGKGADAAHTREQYRRWMSEDDVDCGPGNDSLTKDWRDTAIRCETIKKP